MAERIDLNQADRDELASLPEIDDETAQRIVDYRESVRPFSDVSELSAVEGISEETLQAVGDRLTVSDSAENVREEGLESASAAAGGPESTSELGEADAPQEIGVPEENGAPETESEITPVDAEKQNGRVPPEAEVAPLAEEEEEPLDEDEIVFITGDAVEEEAPLEAPTEEPEETVEAVSADAGPAPADEERAAASQPAAVSQPVTAPQPAPARSGSSFWGHLVAASVGAVSGVVLTLAFLMLLNGTLRLNDTAGIDELETQVDQVVSTVQAEQTGLNEDIDALDERITILVAVDEETAADLVDTQEDLILVEDDLAGVAGEVGALQEKAIELDERLVAVAISAENFDAFLSGLRDLLATMPEPAAGSVLSPTGTITIPTPTGSAPKTGGSPTPLATRTPRPTATPFALPDRH